MESVFRMLMWPSRADLSNKAHNGVGYGAGWIFVIMSQEENCDPIITSSFLILLPLILQVKDVTGSHCTSGAPVPIEMLAIEP